MAALSERVRAQFDPAAGSSIPAACTGASDADQLHARAADRSPDIASSEKIIRTCVHCGFCTATCPTYVLLGDELDSPRGRIYLMKEMLEKGGPPAPQTVKHVDRCLSCLSCMTTCPSGVNYMHLVDHARAYIEEHHVRPWPERLLRSMLARGAARSRRVPLGAARWPSWAARSRACCRGG